LGADLRGARRPGGARTRDPCARARARTHARTRAGRNGIRAGRSGERADPLRGCLLRVPAARGPGARGHLARTVPQTDGGAGGPERSRQEHAGAPADAPGRPERGSNHLWRGRSARARPCAVALDASRPRIRWAAAAANASELIEALPAGLDTPVGEGARRLSAGQAQRVALARAFLADRPLLIMDEPTAHLDDGSVAAVIEAIARVARGRTTLLIAHEPLLAGMAEEVYLVEDGRLE